MQLGIQISQTTDSRVFEQLLILGRDTLTPNGLNERTTFAPGTPSPVVPHQGTPPISEDYGNYGFSSDEEEHSEDEEDDDVIDEDS